MPERGRHGMAPWGHFAMPWLFVYPYTFISILLSVLLYIYIATLSYWCIDVLLYCFISTLSYICIALFISIWIYRNINISILVLFPFASFLHARRCCVFRKHGETAQEQRCSSLQSSKGERSNIPSGALRTTPHTCYGCCTLSGLPSESKARSFSQKLNVARASLREWGLLSASATWSIRPLGKSTASYIFVYIYIAVLAYYCIDVYLYCHITLSIYFLQ